MKKWTINYSWPASLSDFTQDNEQENFTRGKLKVFYKGETSDHRYFSDDFAEELVKSLPYTPVVSHYDEEEDDFVGHASQQQIYGMVDPMVDPSFETDEEGKQWCICDVVLYTERPDKIGEVAKKIIGHEQSLELDPNTVEYKVNYDEKKRFKNIEFTAGKFVGVSVLGKNQKPAFKGSEFFAVTKDFEEKMNILREYCESKAGQTGNGGKEMDFNEFITLSWGDIAERVFEKVYKEYENTAYPQLIDMFDDSVICRFYYYHENKCRLMRIRYTCDENGNVELGAVNEVYIAYEDIVSQDNTNEMTENEITTENVVTQVEEGTVNTEIIELENNNETESTNNEPTQTDAAENAGEQEVANPEIVSTVMVEEVVIDNPAEKEQVETNEETEQESQPNTSSAALTESERAEFEALKKEKRLALVNSYKDSLSKETIASLIAKVDTMSYEALELELLKAYKAAKEIQHTKVNRSFTLPDIKNVNNNDSLDSFVNEHLNK